MTSIARTGEPRVRPLKYYYKLTPLISLTLCIISDEMIPLLA